MLVTELAAVPQFTREYSRLDSRSGNGVPSRQLARCLFLVPPSPRRGISPDNLSFSRPCTRNSRRRPGHLTPLLSIYCGRVLVLDAGYLRPL